ncbi:MAG TPA: Stp1/IreP family PP2C-type Ser/Thr phosphatase [Solirubrobacteraceae bacterium]|jgi:protein phosphatase|nr:Stp1/IreP family PP2C-type Ser/Thr phosphatase [Solirubrobacteraceae bacterium]
MLRVVEHWSGTDTGLQRRANEDSLLVRSPLFVVADGMGGAQAGEVASRMAVEAFGPGLRRDGDVETRLVEQVREANARINRLSHERPEHAGMGTTITVLYVGEHEVSIAHVGDSRAYRLRDGELLRLTDDHSLVDELIRQGRLTPAEAEEHPQRSVITRALGPEPSVEVDVTSVSGLAGDVYLLCSDGLTTMLGEPDLHELLSAHERVRDAGEALIAAANAAGGKDNITVVLLRLEELPGGGTDGYATATSVLEPAAIEHPDAASTVARRLPRRPAPTESRRRGRLRRRRGLGVSLATLAVVAVLGAAAYLALQSVYFIATNQRGLVTIFQGVPYELPAGIKLYSSYYVSGVSAAKLAPAQRQALLDHAWRSERDAAGLVRQLELGQLSGG